MPKNIFIDIDSTVHPFEKIFNMAACDMYGACVDFSKQTSWFLEQNPKCKMSPDQIASVIMAVNSPEYINQMVPYTGCVDIINLYKENDYTVTYLTGRQKAAHKSLATWLMEHNFIGKKEIKSSSLICFGEPIPSDGGSIEEKKIQFIGATTKTKPSIIIDDNPELLKLASYTSFLLPSTITHPWNKEIVEEYNIVNASTWKKLAKKLTEVYGLPKNGR
jgi:hypothetical protein